MTGYSTSLKATISIFTDVTGSTRNPEVSKLTKRCAAHTFYSCFMSKRDFLSEKSRVTFVAFKIGMRISYNDAGYMWAQFRFYSIDSSLGND